MNLSRTATIGLILMIASLTVFFTVDGCKLKKSGSVIEEVQP